MEHHRRYARGRLRRVGPGCGLVPEAVYDEVVERGRAEGYADALSIEEATDTFLEATGLPASMTDEADELRTSAGLDRGEAEAIVLPHDVDGRCLTDDHAARRTAQAPGVPVGGTIFVLLEALDAGLLWGDGYLSRLDDLVDGEFRMSASLYRRAVGAGQELGED